MTTSRSAGQQELHGVYSQKVEPGTYVMNTDIFDPSDFAKSMRAEGYWLDRLVDDYLVDAITATPDKLAFAAYRADREGSVRFSYRELGEAVSLAAGGMTALGIHRGDIVAVQLPNWWEFIVMTLACGRIGAVMNPLMPIFREHELNYMLGFAQTKLIVVPKMFRGFDHARMAAQLQQELPSLQHVIVVDGDDENSFDRCLLESGHRVDPPTRLEVAPLAPGEMSVLMFTSGTTGSPKGVMHNSNSLIACTYALGNRFGLKADDVLFACSPVGHMTGYVATVVLTIRLGGTMILQDVWEGRRGVTLMTAEGVTHTAASTPFLADICDSVAAGAPRPPRLRSFLCGGAPIPPILVERASRELGLKVCSLWGMTEVLSGTLTEPHRAADKSSSTDGRALEGMEVRIVDTEGVMLPTYETGRLMARGAQMFMGYYKRPDLEAFDAAGWFDTGDLAYMDDEGYIRINGRNKDVLIRGGENVPVGEIESLLYAHAAVAAVAIVGYPDRRLGERGCAFIVLRPGAKLDLADVQIYMSECRVAKQYWPERIEIIDELPRTTTGKIQKFILKELAKSYGDTEIAVVISSALVNRG